MLRVMKRLAEQVTWRGPFKAEQLRAGDPYELSRGHTIQCLPVGGRGGRANLVGGAVLDSDPAVRSAGVDTGFSPEPGTMRAPDIAVGDIPDAPGWVKGTPPLAVEYADTGQDEDDLQSKIVDLLEAGTKLVWVVRLVGPRRVEVYEPGARVRTMLPGEMLSAPEILQNAIPVEALYDRDAAHRVMLRNLLQREGFESLEAVKEEGLEQGLEQGERRALRASIREVLSARNLSTSAADDARIDACSDVATLRRWLRAAVAAPDATSALED
jgi:Uma2 family endonuclease